MHRVLVLTSRYPYPVIGGDRLRIYHICKALSQRFQLTLASLCEHPAELRHRPTDHVFESIHRVYLPKWKSYGSVLRSLRTETPLQLAYYRSPEFQELVARLAPHHEVILAHLIRTAQFVPVAFSGVRILEMTDAISMNYERMQSLPQTYSWKKRLYSFEKSRVANYEIRATPRFHKTWLVSDVDASFIGGASRKVEVIPNGVDQDRLPFLNGGQGNVIAFIGNMVSAQNQDGCLHFAEHILPAIRQHSDIRLRVIGNCPEYFRDRLSRIPAVEATGLFDRIEPHIRNVFSAVCSVRAAAGMQNKVLEYLAMGLPCVTTAEGAEGIRVRDGQEALIYHSATEAASHILRLHSDPELRRRLARAGSKLIASEYNWERIYSRLVNSVAELVEMPVALPRAG